MGVVEAITGLLIMMALTSPAIHPPEVGITFDIPSLSARVSAPLLSGTVGFVSRARLKFCSQRSSEPVSRPIVCGCTRNSDGVNGLCSVRIVGGMKGAGRKNGFTTMRIACSARQPQILFSTYHRGTIPDFNQRQPHHRIDAVLID